MNIEKLSKKLSLTRRQEDDICYIIGEWYVQYKDFIKNGNIGFAKEILKAMICGYCLTCSKKECECDLIRKELETILKK